MFTHRETEIHLLCIFLRSPFSNINMDQNDRENKVSTCMCSFVVIGCHCFTFYLFVSRFVGKKLFCLFFPILCCPHWATGGEALYLFSFVKHITTNCCTHSFLIQVGRIIKSVESLNLHTDKCHSQPDQNFSCQKKTAFVQLVSVTLVKFCFFYDRIMFLCEVLMSNHYVTDCALPVMQTSPLFQS